MIERGCEAQAKTETDMEIAIYIVATSAWIGAVAMIYADAARRKRVKIYTA